MQKEQIEVPDYVLHALEEVRRGSKYNMFSSSEVVYEMNELNHYKAVNWLVEIRENGTVHVNKDKYMTALTELGNVKSLLSHLAKEDLTEN